ncbi:hypothetical protein As57867_015770, partial [Aphanomyces stellatus]
IVPDGNAQPKPHVKLSAPIGLVYLVLSLGINAWYLYLLLPYTKNDLWWPGFNTTGIQTFLADAINTHLACQHFGAIDLRSLGVVQKTYYDRVTAPPQIDFRFPQARRAVFGNLTFESVVLAMRNSSMTDNLGMGQPYCWVDLHRTFELAHTAARQRRCVKWAANAAMYLETLLRNAMPGDDSVILDENIGTNALWSKVLNETLYTPMTTLPGGTEWVASIRSHQLESVTDELATWSSHGLTYWSTQIKNNQQAWFEDSISVVNAIGITQRFTISRNPLEGTHALNQDTSTSERLFVSFEIDLNMCMPAEYNCSVVRGTNRSLDALGLDWDQLYYDQTAPGTNIVRSFLGPLGAIDAKLVDIPQSLTAFFLAFQSTLTVVSQNEAYNAVVKDVFVDSVPLTWRNLSSYSGSLLCPRGSPLSFIQSPFSWGDDCSTQKPLQVTLNRNSALFAMVAMNYTKEQVDATCTLCVSTVEACVERITALLDIYDASSQTLASLQLANHMVVTKAAVHPLNISLLQLVASNQMLVQPLLDESLWSFFGWIALYEWLQAKREVILFEGDVGVVTLISEAQPFYAIEANTIELPSVACVYVALVNVYVSIVMYVVGIMVLISSLQSRSTVEGTHLVFFNRIAGAVYVGRPLLVLRGLTAIVLLSVASTSFQDNSGFARLTQGPRSFFDIAVLAGEATWLTYAIQDVFVPLTQPYTNVYAPLNAAIVWCVLVIVEWTMPFESTITLDRTCTALNLGHSVSCTNGVVQFGSLGRFTATCATQVAATVVSYILVRSIGVTLPLATAPPHAVLPATAQAFFLPFTTTTTASVATMHHPRRLPPEIWMFDTPSAIVCGLLPMRRGSFFDIKRWVFVQNAPASPRGATLRQPTLSSVVSLHEKSAPHPNGRWLQWIGVCGLCYMLASCVGSFLFLRRIQSTLVNDLWWPAFNATGHQTFIANFFVLYLQLGHVQSNLLLDSPTYGDTTSYDGSATSIRAPLTYPSTIQDEANSLENVVLGLRSMDSCLHPWIFTAYCYVDFGQSWQMASSASRQHRCAHQETPNGAVYLESILRNAAWSVLDNLCWGNALDTAVFSFLRQSNRGTAWLDATRTVATSVAGEVDHWRQFGIESYRTQWQNFKRLGVTEYIEIQNAFGVAYPFTIRNSVGVMTSLDQTSYKMYWGLANDLLAIAANATSMGGRSLVRQSPDFAFGASNATTLEAVLMQNNTLVSPLGPGLSLVRNMLGPFGTVDMVRVNCPSMLQSLYRQLNEAMMTILNSSPTVQEAYLDLPNPYLGLVPPVNFFPTIWADAWNNYSFRGGDLLCDATSEDLSYPGAYFSSSGTCSATSFWYESLPSLTLKALLAANLTSLADPTLICQHDTTPLVKCIKKLTGAMAYLTQYMDATAREQFGVRGRAVATYIHDALELEYMQFLDTPTDFAAVSLSRLRFFDPTEPDVVFFLWGHLFEWVEGNREAVCFTGDNGSITLLSKYSWDARGQAANPSEIPRNVSTLTFLAAAYITIVLFIVAVTACVYIVLARGYVEGLNMFQFNRVAGAVWIGRPLMLIRGNIALAQLSTATLVLKSATSGITVPVGAFAAPVTRMVATLPQVFVTLLSASEVNWVIYLYNDVFSVITRDFTYWGSALAAATAWALTVLWSFLVPVQHSATVARQCHVEAVDWHVTCMSGLVEIGRVSRFTGLLVLAVGLSIATYVVLRTGCGRAAYATQTLYRSQFLSSVATYSFALAHWIHDDGDGRIYLDKASALLNGMIAVEWRRQMFVFDIKTWRGYVMDTSVGHASMDHCANCRRFAHAVRMTE